jgi:D-arabinose 1-dehydrogenase-like Zn-dependent alcohol dehydrogenase
LITDSFGILPELNWVGFLFSFFVQVTALSSSASKEAEAKHFGARHFVVAGSEDEKKMANTQELILNTVSAANDYSAQLKMLRPNGKLCIVGLPNTDIKVTVPELVFMQKEVRGSLR